MLSDYLELSYSWMHGDPDSRPFGSFESLVFMMFFYLALMGVLQYFMKGRQPMPTLWLTIPQNFVMCIYSAYAFMGSFSVIWRNWTDLGYPFFTIICDPSGSMMKGLDYWMYTFLVSKYVEYFDSIALVLKGKKLCPPDSAQHFLHLWHHFVTSSIVWFSWRHGFSVAWVGPLTNAFVHTLMYGYYFLAELKLIDRRYGGMFITPIQLVQFVICLVLGTYESVKYFLQGNQCNNLSPAVASWLWFNYMVFFVFFVNIFFDKSAARSTRRPVEDKEKKA